MTLKTGKLTECAAPLMPDLGGVRRAGVAVFAAALVGLLAGCGESHDDQAAADEGTPMVADTQALPGQEPNKSAASDVAPPPAQQPAPPLAPAGPSVAYGPDIVGLRLGMSIDEVTRVIEAMDKDYRVQTHEAVISIWVSSKEHTFDVFTTDVVAHWAVPKEIPASEKLSIKFSMPPEAQLAVLISRGVEYGWAGQRPTFDGYVDLLTEKYGPPSAEQARTIAGAPFVGEWQISQGKRDCPFAAGLSGAASADCNAQLNFRFSNSDGMVAGAVDSKLVDSGFAWQQQEKYNAYVEKLRAGVVQEGLDSAPKPEL